ncbi:CDP-diacylglycerol--serine O-phosphatidyltransferase [Rufibacter ruber]|uniref:CDP-diacylglycerol--serine O-phosphatidyltransferase n=1 Tax=Rufibacter ruber TaxID=1783499 RepID=UPI0008363162|nr:CDP-diacylglycerol--serine O-phosphatidyltransferase [Rufibacter ruber]
MKKHLPNLITCLNLFCGCLAVYFIFQQKLTIAAYLVALAVAFDFWDGMIARLLHVHSEIGKQLDSLADMVSFGVVPGAMMLQLLKMSLAENTSFGAGAEEWLPFAGFILTIFSALRLAKFNLDTRQTSSFIGVPTPTNTMLMVSFPLILANDTYGLSGIILNPFFLLGITLLFSYLLISEVPLFALKFKNFKWQDNQKQFIFLGLAIVLLSWLNFTAVPLLVAFYVLISLIKPSAI